MLWYCYRNPRMPLAPKLCAMLVVAYALSPVDLIPDFIPVVGYLDELILLPVAIYLILKLIPAQLLEDSRAQAAQRLRTQPSTPVRYMAATLVVLGWVLMAWLLWSLVPAAPGSV